MGKQTVPIVTCDVCHRSELIHHVKIEPAEVRLGEVKVSGDLCEDHSGPVREAMKILPTPRKRRRTRFEDSVVDSPEDIPRE